MGGGGEGELGKGRREEERERGSEGERDGAIKQSDFCSGILTSTKQSP